MIFTNWPAYQAVAPPGNQTGIKPNSTNWPDKFNWLIPQYPSFNNETAVDDIFGWGEKYGRRAPMFSKLPQPFKSVFNTTALETDSIYILFKAGDPKNGLFKDEEMKIPNPSPWENAQADPPYQICSIRSTMYPNCSTHYHASKSGGNLTSHCNDPHDNLAYIRSVPSAPKGVTNTNWTNVANRWATTMSLNAGITDDPASNARLLTQLIPLTPSLDPLKPSIAEALAVMAGCTLILTGLDTPLTHFWPLPDTQNFPSFPLGASDGFDLWPTFPYQKFKAKVKSQEYSSGYTQKWQGIFYVVLVGTFVLNGFCLCFLLVQRGLVTDYMEPHNLFALAVNSPASKAVEGACGGGVEGGMWGTKWHVDFLDEREHFYVHSIDEAEFVGGSGGRGRVGGSPGESGQGPGGQGGGGSGRSGDGASVRSRARRRKGDRASTIAEEESGWEMQQRQGSAGGSPVSEQFKRLSSRPSSLF